MWHKSFSEISGVDVNVNIDKTSTGNTLRHVVGPTIKKIVDGNVNRLNLVVLNNSKTESLYIGYVPGITQDNSFILYPGRSISFDTFLGSIYAFSPNTEIDVRTTELPNPI